MRREDPSYVRRPFEGPRVVAVAAAVLLVELVAALGPRPLDVGARALVIITAQTSLLWFLLAFVASPLVALRPSAISKWLLRNRRYASRYYTRDTLVTLPVTAHVSGALKSKAQLVVSHGCAPFTTTGAWCSPGFWRNAEDAAWTLTGFAKTDDFNGNVSTAFYGADLVPSVSLFTVLSAAGGTYKGAGVAGTDPRTQPPNDPLNPFNATGAFLTDQIGCCGSTCYSFDPSLVDTGTEESCPIDNHGAFKQGPCP